MHNSSPIKVNYFSCVVVQRVGCCGALQTVGFSEQMSKIFLVTGQSRGGTVGFSWWRSNSSALGKIKFLITRLDFCRVAKPIDSLIIFPPYRQFISYDREICVKRIKAIFDSGYFTQSRETNGNAYLAPF